MTSSFKFGSLMIVTTLAVSAGCSSSNLMSTGTGGSIGTGGSTDTGGTGGGLGTGGSPGSGGCNGTTHAGEVPSEHRAVATACTASTRSPAIPDGGLLSCTKNSDCTTDSSPNFFSTCLHGQCSFDQCMTDADCGATDVCVCANDYYGGNTEYHANVCVPAKCRVDSDCGAAGYCSPTRGYCGSYGGYYCHTAADSCVDATKDCAACGTAGPACVYAPTTGTFVCGSDFCAG